MLKRVLHGRPLLRNVHQKVRNANLFLNLSAARLGSLLTYASSILIKDAQLKVMQIIFLVGLTLSEVFFCILVCLCGFGDRSFALFLHVRRIIVIFGYASGILFGGAIYGDLKI